MPASQDQLPAHTLTNVVVRERIGTTDAEVAKEALQQLTWLGVDPFLIHQALEAAMQIVSVIPQDAYTLDDPPHPS